ncbi:MAG: colicin V production protein [Alphaproteobacteria bacterium]|nr:MAG: colicin V production protein [Alphaproteobacteria bacterium]
MDALTSFDIIVLILVVLAALAGLARGFVGEIVSLLAWAAGIMAVRFFYTPAKAIAMGLISTESGAAILALVVLFLGAFIIVRVAGGRLSRSTKASVVGPVDRVLGLGFGAAKGVLAAALVFLLVNLTFDTIDPGEPSPDWLAKARTAPTLAMVSKALVDFVEEHRRVAPDTAAVGDPHAGLRRGGSGYAPADRSALDKLLDAQEKSTPSTPI